MILIKDNFFTNPDEIRNKALSVDYKEPRKVFYSLTNNNEKLDFVEGWRGFRCEIKSEENSIKQNILNLIISHYKLKGKYNIDLYYHYTLEKTKETCFPSFDSYKYHTDIDLYAGVVYLYPNPPQNSGTTIFYNGKKKHIENIFNRLICYPCNLLHGPTDLFGVDIFTGRLTLTFFISVDSNMQKINKKSNNQNYKFNYV
jgi:hypothetical protein